MASPPSDEDLPPSAKGLPS